MTSYAPCVVHALVPKAPISTACGIDVRDMRDDHSMRDRWSLREVNCLACRRAIRAAQKGKVI